EIFIGAGDEGQAAGRGLFFHSSQQKGLFQIEGKTEAFWSHVLEGARFSPGRTGRRTSAPPRGGKTFSTTMREGGIIRGTLIGWTRCDDRGTDEFPRHLEWNMQRVLLAVS